jgi:glycine hydroxymethyltransferase
MTDVLNAVEVHDASVLQWASDLLDRAGDPAAMQREVVAAVQRNARWRGEACLNLLAPEAPMSPVVRELLSAEGGGRTHRAGEPLVCRDEVHR